ncbi:MAG: sulfatase [Planctomycetes bacterium]|nr:sulfatase [Planctomycetota bacterium]
MASKQRNRGRGGNVDRRGFLSQVGLGAAGAAAYAGTSQAAETAKPAPELTPAQKESQERGVRNRAGRAITKKAKSNGLNLVVVIADTFRIDHLGAYGAQRVKTPCLDQLASESVVFDNAFADGLPTIPCRRCYQTGKSVLPGSAWIPHPAGEVNMAQILGAHGFWTGLVSDVYHYFKPDMNLHVGFDTWEWLRGHESDAYLGGPREKFQPKDHMPADLWNPNYDKSMRTYMMNSQNWESEDDYLAAQTVSSAVNWLGQNATNKPFMLWVEMFDPHEPWDAPPRFQKMYREDYGFERFLFGYGVQGGANKPDFTPHLPVIRDLYAAEVSYVDHCIGRLMESMEKMKLLDDTIVVFTTDHGTHLGELGYVQKQSALLNSLVMHLPLLIRHPDRSTAGKRVAEMVSAIDFAPTFCHMLGIDDQEQMDGQNVWPLVTGKTERLNERVFTQFNPFASIRDKKWHYFQHISGKNRGAGPCLYDLEQDPGETKNVIDAHADVAARMRSDLGDRLEKELPEAAPAPV